MVLQSQMPRDGMSRRYVASSRRKRGSRWPIIGLVAAALIAAIIIFMPDGSGPDNANAASGDKPLLSDIDVPSESPGSIARNVTPSISSDPSSNERTGEQGVTTNNDTARSNNNSSPATNERPSRTNTKPPRSNQPSRDNRRSVALSTTVEKAFKQAKVRIDNGKLVEARESLNDLLLDKADQLTPSDKQNIRDVIAELNEKLIFSDIAYGADPLVDVYTVKSGDVLTVIASRFNTNSAFIQQINGIKNANRIQVGQKIKVIKGPFHIRVDKSEYRLDLMLRRPDGRLAYITSYTVGIGADDSTPVGSFLITDRVEKPPYTNPRTKERFAGGDPKNPVGNYWLRLEGTDENTKKLESYGIHGTIEPETIGTQASLGCVRMLDEDIKELFGAIAVKKTTVQILP